jgi:hypothetical protein
VKRLPDREAVFGVVGKDLKAKRAVKPSNATNLRNPQFA